MKEKNLVHALLFEGVNIESFGELLRFFRMTRGYSQDALAKAAGMKRRQTLADWEAGTAHPRADSRDYLLEITDVLKLTPLQRDCLLKAATLPVASSEPHTSATQKNGSSAEVLEPRNPYKGLRPFTLQSHQDFFGRSRLIRTIVDQLHPQQAANPRFLALLGASGSGKTSLVQAGVIPTLQHDSSEPPWIVVNPLRPGKDPFDTLAQALSDLLPNTNRTMQEFHRAFAAPGYEVLSLFNELAGADHAPVLLVIDQGEELFTQTKNEDTRHQFLDVLVELSMAKNGNCWVLFIARADFYHQFQEHPRFWQLLKAFHNEVSMLEKEELREAIEGPTGLPDVQVVFEGDLATTLLLEVQGRIGGLPLLQFALDRLFQSRQGNCLTEQAYRNMGGVRGAIGHYAQEIYERTRFSERERHLVSQLFLRLVAQDAPVPPQQSPTRRAARLDEFRFVNPADADLMGDILTIFIAARLLTTTEGAGEPVVEVSHEALLEEWPLAQEVFRNHYKDMYLLYRLNQATRDWQRLGQPEDHLYRGSQLKEAQGWAKQNIPSQQETAFLQASARQRMRFFVSLICIVFLLLSTLGAAGWFYHNQSPDPTHVTTIQDTGVGSLRWCIDNAPSGSTITFDEQVRGTIKFTSDLSFEGKKLTIQGPSASLLALGSGLTGAGIFVFPRASIMISDLSFRDSTFARQSFITNEGVLRLTHIVLSDNSGRQGSSGVLYNEGTVTIDHSILSGNSATLSGGIVNVGGRITVTDSTFSDNSADDGIGGAIYNQGTVTIANSILSGNSAHSIVGGSIGGGNGGAIYNSSGTVTITNSTLSDNSAYQGDGGGADGGGIDNITGTITITNSTLSGNSTHGGNGGAIDNITGIVSVINSTLSSNFAYNGTGNFYNGTGNGGGIYSTGRSMVTVINSTLSGNFAQHDGGSIHNLGGTTNITFCTIYDNTASRGGGLFLEDDHRSDGTIFKNQATMRNSLVVANHAAPSPDISGAFSSEGYNLIGNWTGAVFTTKTGDQFLSDLSHLFAKNVHLDNNGGPTQTLALLADQRNPALNTIPLPSCWIDNAHSQSIDQRGMQRPGRKKWACDVGAYESQL